MPLDHTSITTDKPWLIPEFRSFIIGRFVFVMGLRMTVTVIGWWMYIITNSKLALGFVGLSEVIPAVALSLYAGHKIDISEKRSILLQSVILYAGCIILLYLLSLDQTAKNFDHWTIAGMICAVVACTGAIRAFAGPSFGTILSGVVPKKALSRAANTSSATWLTGSILGHAVGGWLIALIGIPSTFLVILIFVFTGLFLLARLKPQPPTNHHQARTWQSVKEGIDYVLNTKEILGALSLDLFAVLFGGAVAMVPVFAKDILQVGPEGFGWLNAASDLGAIITVVWLTAYPLRRGQGKLLHYSVAGFGACIILFAVSSDFLLSFFALMMSGALDGISVVIRGTILQIKTPDELKGRVMSVNSMFISSSNELGQFESGLMAKLMGTVPSVILGGSMTIAIAIFSWFKFPVLRKMRYRA